MITNANDSIHNSEQGVQDGLTKREYFAAMAMQGVLANAWERGSVKDCTESLNPITVAQNAVEHADALIEALNKKQTT